MIPEARNSSPQTRPVIERHGSKMAQCSILRRRNGEEFVTDDGTNWYVCLDSLEKVTF
jgi:hypothetical protein